MQRFDGGGLGDTKGFITTLQRRAAKVIRGEMLKLKIRASGTVENQNLLGEGSQIGVIDARSSKRRTQSWLHWFFRLLVLV